MKKLCSIFDHQNKSTAYREALAKAGYVFTDRVLVQGLRFILTDADWREGLMKDAAELHTPVFLYPHAARPMVQYDGCIEPKPVTAMFTQAPEGRRIMEKIGYPYPVEVTGWAYSEVRPFRPVEKVKRVLFAPIHPNANGYLSKVDKDLNRKTYDRLYDACREMGAELSVRYVDSLEACGLNGIPAGEFVELHKGKKNSSTYDIETADVVAAHQTFAYMSVAMGVPTVMMGEDVPPRTGNSDASFRYVEHWDDYKTELMYPLDILKGAPVEVISRACAGYAEVEDWKERLIGRPFDGPEFVRKLEAYL